MAQMTGEFPRLIPRAVWLTARARNAVHRPAFIGAVGAGAFIATLVALILAPQQVKRVTSAPTAPPTARPDTQPITAALSHARTRLTTAESSLARARATARVAPPPVVDTLGPKLVARRDSLTSAVNDLDGLITRVETAPVSASFRALAESPQLTSSTKVRALLDSLAEVERERDAFGNSAGADPAFLALSSRATELGRAIQTAAQERREAIRLLIAQLSAPAARQAVALAPVVDTSSWIAERDSAQSLISQAETALSDARGKIVEHDRAIERARDDARLDASPAALLAAALVFGIALGFGSAFVGEMRHPRVSDEHELERVTGARILATVRPRARMPADRDRRSADRSAPPYFDPGADGYQLTYLHVARAGASRLMLTVTGEDTGIAAIVAANVAAIAADEARSTIIVDTDGRTSPVAAALRIHAEPGFADIIDRQVDWAEVTSPALVGRDRSIDVIPSGVSMTNRNPAQIVELFRQAAARLARHYEAIVIVAPLDQAKAGLPGVLAIPDTILSARVGHTRIDDVQSALDGIRAAGGNPVGIVLWDAPPPALPTPERIARARRPLNTPEMQSLTPSR
jgi:Mrp family chromosome partitioning ATPase